MGTFPLLFQLQVYSFYSTFEFIKFCYVHKYVDKKNPSVILEL